MCQILYYLFIIYFYYCPILSSNKLTNFEILEEPKKFFTSDGHTERQSKVKNEDWSDLYAETDPNKAFEIFQNKYSMHYNDSLTIKSFYPTHHRHPKQPWISPEILKKIRKRDRIAKLSHRRSDYCQLRNEIVAECRKAEKIY